MDTPEEYLSAAFAAIDESYDSVSDYLAAEIGLGPEQRKRLKRRYVE